MGLVSIIMPVYNAAPYLVECLDSILRQHHSTWELIAVDDFSTDASYVILKSYADKDARIRVLKNDRKGILPALQNGYAQSKGMYITRMDADDVMPEMKICTLLETLLSQEHSVAVGKVEYFATGKSLSEGYVRYADWLNAMIDNQDHFSHIYKECVIPSPCWMMRRDDFDAIGGFSVDRYPEDYDLAFRMYAYGIKVVGSPRVLHLWRDHEVRASRTDRNYSDQAFLPLKLHYFNQLEWDPDRPLLLWGGGQAGKAVAKNWVESGISFRWVTNNANKIGHNIYGVILESVDTLDAICDSMIVTAVRTPSFAQELRAKSPMLTANACSVISFY